MFFEEHPLSLAGVPYKEFCYYCFDEISESRPEIIPLAQETLRLAALFPLEHLVVLEVPVNKARVYNLSPKQCSHLPLKQVWLLQTQNNSTNCPNTDSVSA